jgi:hypothetical protein
MRPHRQRRGGGLDLCGSMPITIIEMDPFAGGADGGVPWSTVRLPARGRSRLRRVRPRRRGPGHKPPASQPRTGGRKVTSEAGHDTSGRLRPVIIQSAKPVGPYKSGIQVAFRKGIADAVPHHVDQDAGREGLMVISSRVGLVPARPMVRRASTYHTRRISRSGPYGGENDLSRAAQSLPGSR